MELLKALQKRRSVRKFTEEIVSKEDIDILMHAAMSGPSACNAKPWEFYVVETETGLQNLRKATKYTNMNAPLAIVVCSDTEKAWTRPYDGKQTTDIDASIITDHMMLEATDLDLGSVWIGIFKPDVIKDEFHLPAHLEPISILAIGYVESSPANLHDHLATRLSLDELVLKIF